MRIDITGIHEDQIDELRAENPDAELFTRTKPDLEGKGTLVEMPCSQWDGKGKACVLAFGHEGDHEFKLPTPETDAQSNPGDAGLPDTLQE